MYVFSWRIVSALTWVLFGAYFPHCFLTQEIHQNNPHVSAETVRHSSTYIILCFAPRLFMNMGWNCHMDIIYTNGGIPGNIYIIHTIELHPRNLDIIHTNQLHPRNLDIIHTNELHSRNMDIIHTNELIPETWTVSILMSSSQKPGHYPY